MKHLLLITSISLLSACAAYPESGHVTGAVLQDLISAGVEAKTQTERTKQLETLNNL